MAAKKKPEFTRCPHCPQRFGSEQSLGAHVEEHRRKHRDAHIKPEHKVVTHPAYHVALLKQTLKKAGHGR